MSTAAFFDLDGTLIPGSANIPLAKAAFRQGFASPTEVLKDLRNGVSFLLKGATDERSAQVRDRILQAVQGHRAADVEALGDYFIHDLVASITPAMREVLDRHGVAGEDRIVVSASPTEIVSRLAHGAGLEYGVGTTAARDEAGDDERGAGAQVGGHHARALELRGAGDARAPARGAAPPRADRALGRRAAPPAPRAPLPRPGPRARARRRAPSPGPRDARRRGSAARCSGPPCSCPRRSQAAQARRRSRSRCGSPPVTSAASPVRAMLTSVRTPISPGR